MGFVVEFETDSAVLRDETTAAPDVVVSVENLVLPSAENPRLVLAARGDDLDGFERCLDSDPAVREHVLLSSLHSRRVYSVTLADGFDALGIVRTAVDHDVAFLSIELRGGTVRVRARIPSRDALRELRNDYREQDVSFDLVRIYRESADTGQRYGLTERQTRALVLAHDRGYYESPRCSTLQEIAEELGITRQALSGRIRRGLDRLIAATLK